MLSIQEKYYCNKIFLHLKKITKRMDVNSILTCAWIHSIENIYSTQNVPSKEEENLGEKCSVLERKNFNMMKTLIGSELHSQKI